MEAIIPLLIILFVVYLALARSRRPRKQTVIRKNPSALKYRSKKPEKGYHNNFGMTDPSNQLKAISKVNFEKKKLMNASEYRVFASIEEHVSQLDGGYRVMAQTSLGELIGPTKASGDWKDQKDAFASINSKRVDFAIIDKFGLLSLAIEYQGSGHYHQKTFMRDAVKKEALRRAKVPYLEVPKGMKPSELKSKVTEILAPES